MNQTALNRIKDQVNQLPAFSDTVAELLRALDSEAINHALMAEKIGRDPALTARVLRLANSSFYGNSRKIATILQSCMLIGQSMLRNLVYATAVMQAVSPKFSAAEGRDARKLWRHAFAVGAGANVLAQRGGHDPNVAFTVGLLHNMGRLLVWTVFVDEYDSVMSYQKDHDCFLHEAERNVLGFDSFSIGAMVGEHWRLPSIVVESIRHGGDLQTDASNPYSRIVHLADAICRGLGLGCPCDEMVPLLADDCVSQIGLTWEDVRLSIPRIAQATRNIDVL